LSDAGFSISNRGKGKDLKKERGWFHTGPFIILETGTWILKTVIYFRTFSMAELRSSILKGFLTTPLNPYSLKFDMTGSLE